MKVDSIIFDLDGTLWNVSEASARGWTAALKDLGYPDRTVTREQIEAVSGKPFDECVAEILPELDPRDLIEKLDHHERLALEEFGGDLYPGVEMGVFILSQFLPVFIVSNCQEWYLTLFAEKFPGLADLIKDSECHGRTSKPKGENLADLIRRNSLQKPVYIGDTAGDLDAALYADCQFIWAAYGFGGPLDGQVQIDSFGELAKIIRS